MRKSSPVIRKRGSNFPDFSATKAAIGAVAKTLRGRNHAVFLEQLKFGLWLLYAKAQAPKWNREMRTLARKIRRSWAKNR